MRVSRRIQKSTLILLLPLLLLGCTESSLFVPDLSGDEEPTLSTVGAGSLVGPKQTLPVNLPEGDRGEYSSLEIAVRTPGGETVYSTIYDSLILSEPVLPDLQLPDLPEGSYLVELLLFDQQEVVARKESLFFLTPAKLSVTGITLYPPTSEIDAQLIAEAHVVYSDPALDPYLRWRFRGSVVSEGFLSGEGGTARLATGMESGVFRVTVEAFPWEPPDGFDLTSPISHSTDVVVRPPQTEDPEAESYLTFSFDGHGRGRGFGLPEEEGEGHWSEEGKPLLTLQDDAFGFLIDEANGFSRQEFLPPVDQDGVIPFRLEITFALVSLGEEGSYLLATGDGRREIVLGLTGEGEPSLFADNGIDSGTIVAPAPQISPGGLVTLGLEVHSSERETQLSFYNGDTLLHEAILPFSLEGAGSEEGVISGGSVPTEPERYLEAGLSRGTLLKAGAKASFVIDHLTLETISAAPSEGGITTLRGGESFELAAPAFRGDALRYTLLTEEAEVYLESELDGARRLLLKLSGGSSLTLLRRDGDLEYIVDDGERNPLPGEAFFIRNAPEDPAVEISRQALSR